MRELGDRVLLLIQTSNDLVFAPLTPFPRVRWMDVHPAA